MKFGHVFHKSVVKRCPENIIQALVYIQVKKLILIVCIFLFLLVPTTNAQNTEMISYQYEEGIKLSKETGKPILLPGSHLFNDDTLLNERIINKINNDFIFINSGPIGSRLSSAIGASDSFKMNSPTQNGFLLLILDSNGKEITHIELDIHESFTMVNKMMNYWQIDSDGNEISRGFDRFSSSDRDDFIFNVLEYSLKKEGKIQRLPSEKTASVNELLATDELIIATTKGYIRDIKPIGNNQYGFNLDDGTGMIYVQYTGGLSSIQENDNIFVKGLLHPHNGILYSDSISDSKIEYSDLKSADSNVPISKTPGFDIILGLVAFVFIWGKGNRKNI